MSELSYQELWLTNRIWLADRRLKEIGAGVREEIKARWAVADAQARQGLLVLFVAFLAALIDLWKARALRGGR